MPKIVALHVGTDYTLLSTRTLILRQAGFVVVPVVDVAEAIQLFLAGDFDMVVICHSVPPEKRQALANFVHSHSSSIPVILVTPIDEHDVTMDAVIMNDPDSLLMTLPKVLGKQPRRAPSTGATTL